MAQPTWSRSWRNLPLLARLLLAAPLLAAAGRAAALDYQVHGFATEGFVLSSGNNFFGHSTAGSFDYFEAGINGAVQLTPRLLLAAEGYLRGAGATDGPPPRLNYGLLDYRMLSGTDSNAGIRLGRIKNPLGFYNDTRDTVFTRPSIVLPESVYHDYEGAGSLLFSSDGLQLYGDAVFGRHELSVIAGAALDHDLNQREKRELFGVGTTPFQVRVKDVGNLRLMDEIDDGRWRFAASAARFRFIRSVPGALTTLDAQSCLYVLSASYNAEHFSITSEYAYNPNRVVINGANRRFRSIPDGGYVQLDYRFNPSWSAFARYDAYFLDRNDRNGGKRAAARPGTDRHAAYAHDGSVGLNWRYESHWGVWAEYHQIYGTATVPPLENPGRRLQDTWPLFLLMGGYRF